MDEERRRQMQKHITVFPSQTCILCNQIIFREKFYAFPCKHSFHRLCVLHFVKSYSETRGSKDYEVSNTIHQILGVMDEIQNYQAAVQKFTKSQNKNNEDLISELTNRFVFTLAGASATKSLTQLGSNANEANKPTLP